MSLKAGISVAWIMLISSFHELESYSPRLNHDARPNGDEEVYSATSQIVENSQTSSDLRANQFGMENKQNAQSENSRNVDVMNIGTDPLLDYSAERTINRGNQEIGYDNYKIQVTFPTPLQDNINNYEDANQQMSQNQNDPNQPVEIDDYEYYSNSANNNNNNNGRFDNRHSQNANVEPLQNYPDLVSQTISSPALSVDCQQVPLMYNQMKNNSSPLSTINSENQSNRIGQGGRYEFRSHSSKVNIPLNSNYEDFNLAQSSDQAVNDVKKFEFNLDKSDRKYSKDSLKNILPLEDYEEGSNVEENVNCNNDAGVHFSQTDGDVTNPNMYNHYIISSKHVDSLSPLNKHNMETSIDCKKSKFILSSDVRSNEPNSIYDKRISDTFAKQQQNMSSCRDSERIQELQEQNDTIIQTIPNYDSSGASYLCSGQNGKEYISVNSNEDVELNKCLLKMGVPTLNYKNEPNQHPMYQNVDNSPNNLNPGAYPNRVTQQQQNYKEPTHRYLSGPNGNRSKVHLINTNRQDSKKSVPHKPSFKTSLRKIFFSKYDNSQEELPLLYPPLVEKWRYSDYSDLNKNDCDVRTRETAGENNFVRGSNRLLKIKSAEQRDNSRDQCYKSKRIQRLIDPIELFKRLAEDTLRHRRKKVYSAKSDTFDYINSDDDDKKLTNKKSPLRHDTYPLDEIDTDEDKLHEIKLDKHDLKHFKQSSENHDKHHHSLVAKPVGKSRNADKNEIIVTANPKDKLDGDLKDKTNHLKSSDDELIKTSKLQVPSTSHVVEHSDHWNGEVFEDNMKNSPVDMKPSHQDSRHLPNSRGMEDLKDIDFETADTEELVTHAPVKLLNKEGKNSIIDHLENSYANDDEFDDDSFDEQVFQSNGDDLINEDSADDADLLASAYRKNRIVNKRNNERQIMNRRQSSRLYNEIG